MHCQISEARLSTPVSPDLKPGPGCRGGWHEDDGGGDIDEDYGGSDIDGDGSASGDNGQYPQWQGSTIITTVSSLQLPSSPTPPQGPGVHLTHLSRRSPGHPLPKVLPC